MAYDDGSGTLRDQIPDPANQPMYDIRGNMVRDDGFDALPNAANPTQKDGFLYEYDIENRLTRVQYDDGSGGPAKNVVEYSYDALGRRVESVKYDSSGQNPATTRFYYDGQNVLAEYSYDAARSEGSREQIVRTYVNGTQYIDERIVMRNYTGTGEQLGDHYYFTEELYSVAATVAPNGRLEEAYVYDTYGQATIWEWPKGDIDGDGMVDGWDRQQLDDYAFGYMLHGTPTPHADADFDYDGDVDSADLAVVTGNLNAEPVELASSEVGNPYLFTGRPTDTLGSFTYGGRTEHYRIQDNRNRTYDPKHGRWLQRDPLGYMDGPNLYQYVRSRPAVMLDPSGTACYEYVLMPGGAGGYYVEVPCRPVTDHDEACACTQELFWEWLMGDPPGTNHRNRVFCQNDVMTKELLRGDGAQKARQEARAAAERACRTGAPILTGKTVYTPSTGRYICDYLFGIPSLGYLTNPVTTFVGGFTVTWTVTNLDCCDGKAEVAFRAFNASTLESCTRNPITRRPICGNDPFGPWGPMGTTTQTFRWTDTLTFEPVSSNVSLPRPGPFPPEPTREGQPCIPMVPVDAPCPCPSW